jgi:hypothetical protein
LAYSVSTMSRKKQPRVPPRFTNLAASAAEVADAFAVAVKACCCPACGRPFTDAAVSWGMAWREGYVDCIRAEGRDIRDGPFKIKCDTCGRRSMYNIFSQKVELVSE